MTRPSAHFAVVLSLFVVLAAYHAVGEMSRESRRKAPQCHIQHISASHPYRRVVSEGGVTELWDDNEEQFHCAGLSAMRSTIQSQCMSLPNYSPSPRLVYIQRGRGLMGILDPGCTETFQSTEQPFGKMEEDEHMMRYGDQHQKIYRIRQGDIVSIPAGSAHWCYNDGNEELVAFSVTDLLSWYNLLDPTDKFLFLAGGQPRRPYEGEARWEPSRMVNILQGFDASVISEAFGIPMETARKMRREDERGIIVKVQHEAMRSIIRSSTMEEQLGPVGPRIVASGGNEMEETYCNMKVHHYLDNPQEADIYSKQKGHLCSVNIHKLPILQFIGMSAEKANLRSSVLYGPHWYINCHTLVYITRGEGRSQIVSAGGEKLFDQNVKQGDVFIIPQFMSSLHVAGDNGVEWVSFKTSTLPMRSPLSGRTSVIRGMPADVVANAYRIPYDQALRLKYNNEDQMVMFTPRIRGPHEAAAI